MLAPYRPIPNIDPITYARHGFNWCHEVIFTDGQWSRSWDRKKVSEAFYANSFDTDDVCQSTLYKEQDGRAVIVKQHTPRPQFVFDFD